MEGLIPYIIDAIWKQKPGHMNRKSLSHSHSDSSERSYHLLLGSDSFNGSSHRRSNRSEFLELVSPAAVATTSSHAANNLRNRKS
ncbi:beta-D-xylosidase 5 [Spatholobus suberectus]|nr:beta-D-xylosidase 5 [Spatholobus suberectus]